MSVVAKFYVQKITRTEGTADQVVLGAVCRGVENALWSQYTPSGSISMGVLNEAATAQFEEGEEYLVTFTRVPRPMPGDRHPVKPARTKHGYWMCETCGVYPTYDPRPPAEHRPAELDWSAHESVYSPAE